jgi:hypothetical protein
LSQVKTGPAAVEVETLPDEETRMEVEHHVERFLGGRFSGQVTIVLNFNKGLRMPSEVTARRLQVGR